jgi:hypothetical protein
MITPIWYGYNKDGKTHIVHNDAFRDYLLKFKEFQLVVRNKRKPRSNNQNSYYWGVVLYLISKEIGHTPEELHDAFKRKFLKRFDKRGLEFCQSTTELSTTGMMEYVENVRRFASMELGISIPDPNEFDDNFDLTEK